MGSAVAAETVRCNGQPLTLLLLLQLMVLALRIASEPCNTPKLPYGAYLIKVVGDKAFYKCRDIKLVAQCVEEKWILPTTAANCLVEGRSTGVYNLVSRKRRARGPGRRRGPRSGPNIALDSPPLVVVRAGEAASMMCRVENLGSHSITWTRVSDNKVIAIDTNVLIGDPRVTAKFEESLGSILQVGHARLEDQGVYECQVTSRPPMTHRVDLQVLPQGEQLLLPPDTTRTTDQYDFLVSNLTALWKEVGLLRSEIQHHLHAGNTDQEYNKALDEIEVMHHENAVHNHHRPHAHHNLHHNVDLRKHMIDAHGHHHIHQDEGEGHREHNHHHDHQQDIHDHQGLHDHEHDHDDFSSHEDRVDHYHDNDIQESHGGRPYNFGGRDLQPASENQQSDEDNDDSEENNRQNSNSGMVQSQSQHSNHGHGGHSHDHEQRHGILPNHDDGMMVAYCDLQPNKDMPTSNVRGLITISQRKDKKGPVYFDLDLEGFDVQRNGYLHGFHIHALPVTSDNKCGAAKGHFNPFNVHHGGPTAQTRHVGDLGNIRVDEDGELEGYILSDNLVAFGGPNSIIGKSIVVHAGEDDLGLGGAPDSLTTGAAGGRLACCNIRIQPQPRFRIKG